MKKIKALISTVKNFIKKPSLARSIVTFIVLFIYVSFALSPFAIDTIKTMYNGAYLNDSRGYNVNYDYGITFFETGNSDCTLVKAFDKKILIDTTDTEEIDEVIRRLKSYENDYLDAVFLSHFDTDHSGGLLKLLDNVKVGKIYLPDEYDATSYTVKTTFMAISRYNVPYETLAQGDILIIGDMEIDVLMPSEYLDSSNNNSLVFMLRTGNIKTLFTGDIETDGINKLLEYSYNLECDILKASHHGSINGINENFAKAANPKYTVILSGKNRFGLPNSETLDILSAVGSTIYRTDKKGEIHFAFNKNSTSVIINSTK